jgi:hypothetical protein
MKALETETDKAYKICAILGRSSPSYEAIESIIKIINPVKDVEQSFDAIVKILKYRFEISEHKKQCVLLILQKLTAKEETRVKPTEKSKIMSMLHKNHKSIQELRTLGQPYAYIANLYGVSWQTLKKFCVNYNITKKES